MLDAKGDRRVPGFGATADGRASADAAPNRCGRSVCLAMVAAGERAAGQLVLARPGRAADHPRELRRRSMLNMP